MSKIYDALHRAELERGESIESIAQRLATVKLPKTPISFPDHSEENGTESLAQDESPIIDLSVVARVPWKPVMQSLPSLGEKGKVLEQFRRLRSHLREYREINELKAVLVSSGLPQEGKSFVSANLALSLARHKASKVLLIDGDMRRSSLPKILGSSQTPGLTDFLSGSASLAEVIQRPRLEDFETIPAGFSSLFFIPAGSDAGKASDLSGSALFGELIRECKKVFDWIIVDSSPLTLVSDGLNLARHCDASLLVARSGVTDYKIAQQAATEMKSVQVIGFVLNGTDAAVDSAGYYGYEPTTQQR